MRNSVLKCAAAVTGALSMLAFTPLASAGQQQSAENHRIAAECINTVHPPQFGQPNPLAMTATANRSLGCGNANVDLIIYEDVSRWPDREKARSTEHYAVGDISASGLAGDHPENHNPLYAVLLVNGEEAGRSASVPSPHAP